MSRLSAYQQPLMLAIAENAVTPVPTAVGVEVWSTIAAKKLIWNGTAWAAAAGSSGGALSNVAFADFANRRFPTIVNGAPSGAAQGQATQPADFDCRARLWSAQEGSVTPLLFGFNNTTYGSPSAQLNYDNYNQTYEQLNPNHAFEMTRMAFITNSAVAASAGWRQGAPDVFLSNGTNYGGFFFAARFSLPHNLSQQHWFMGLSSTNAVLTGDQVSRVNTVGFSQGVAGGLALVCNGTGTTGTAHVSHTTTIDRNQTQGRVYDVFLYNPRKTKTLYWGLRRWAFDELPVLLRTYTYTSAANAPAAQGGNSAPVALGAHCWVSTGPGTLAANLHLAHAYLETYG